MVVVPSGSPLSLFCESPSPYQWCYWAHQGQEYPTTAHIKGGEVSDKDSLLGLFIILLIPG